MTAHLTGAYRGGSSDGRPGWRISFRYDVVAIEALKATVPSRYREWDEAEKRWWVDVSYEREALRLFPGLEAFMKQRSLFG